MAVSRRGAEHAEIIDTETKQHLASFAPWREHGVVRFVELLSDSFPASVIEVEANGQDTDDALIEICDYFGFLEFFCSHVTGARM